MGTDSIRAESPFKALIRDYVLMGQSLREYLGSLVTPFNVVAAAILAVGIPVTILRFTQGLGAVTNLTHTNPWGIWIGIDVLCGVALAGGGYTIGVAVYVLRLKEAGPLVRGAILTGFLGYLFVVVGLMFDPGRPWRLPYPMFVSLGLTSVMFLVAWHFALYIGAQALEFAPAVFEWLDLRRLHRIVERMTIWVTIIGAIVATGHQSALGGLFLIAPDKLHPLWYSPMLPLFFFISSIVAGISMVIVESTLSHRVFRTQLRHEHEARLNNLTLGLAKAGSAVLFAYFWLKVAGIAAGNGWGYLTSGLGLWFLVEILVFVLLPSYLFLLASQRGSVKLARLTALLAVLGIVVNRINVSIVAFNWQLEAYVPRWTEVVITISIVTALVLSFRWVVNRMPILREHPAYPTEH